MSCFFLHAVKHNWYAIEKRRDSLIPSMSAGATTRAAMAKVSPQYYLCVFVHACVHASMHVCVRVCTHASMHACVYALMPPCTHVCVRVCAQAFMSLVAASKAWSGLAWLWQKCVCMCNYSRKHRAPILKADAYACVLWSTAFVANALHVFSCLCFLLTDEQLEQDGEPHSSCDESGEWSGQVCACVDACVCVCPLR
jgi:hypothetical protein